MDYTDAIKYITSKDNFYIDLGLNRISKVLELMESPQDKLKFIHVAGTNGKGSVCSILESILREAGYKTGLFTSPHIKDYTERIKLSDKEIPKEKFAEYTEKILALGIHLTEFEILTVIGFLYFKDEKVDIVLLETGLGGRLDATNVIKKNLCAVITHIDFDHTERLGDTREKIAYEKAGIIKKGCPVITSAAYEAIKDKADSEGSMLIIPPCVDKKFTNALALKGKHQIENLALALGVIRYAFSDISENKIIEGLKKVKNPCRFEYFPKKNMIIDASHNPNGIGALRENLDYFYPNFERRFVFGCLKTKDYKSMMNILFRDSDEVYLNEFDYPNSCSYKELVSECPVPAKKYNGQNLSADKLNIICGSFYMIGKIIDKITE